jgi:hypothetical protein
VLVARRWACGHTRTLRIILNERFYIFPHPEWKQYIRARMETILEEGTPTLGSIDEVLARLRGGS